LRKALIIIILLILFYSFLTYEAAFKEVYRYVETREWEELPGYLDVKSVILYYNEVAKVYSLKITYYDALPTRLNTWLVISIDKNSDGVIEYYIHYTGWKARLYDHRWKKLDTLQVYKRSNFITILIPSKYYNYTKDELRIHHSLHTLYEVLGITRLGISDLKKSWIPIFNTFKKPLPIEWAWIKTALISKRNNTLFVKIILGEKPPKLPSLNKSKFIYISFDIFVDADGNLSTGIQWDIEKGAEYFIDLNLLIDRQGLPLFKAVISMFKIKDQETSSSKIATLKGIINGTILTVNIPLAYFNLKPEAALILPRGLCLVSEKNSLL